jgi:hypothetical protein
VLSVVKVRFIAAKSSAIAMRSDDAISEAAKFCVGTFVWDSIREAEGGAKRGGIGMGETGVHVLVSGRWRVESGSNAASCALIGVGGIMIDGFLGLVREANREERGGADIKSKRGGIREVYQSCE